MPSIIPDELNQQNDQKFQPTLDAITNNQPESVQPNINFSNPQQENIQDLLILSQQEKQNDIQVHSGSKMWHINSETHVGLMIIDDFQFPIWWKATLWFLLE